VDGTENVLAAAAMANAKRFVYISSVAVYGLNRAPIIEESAATPLLVSSTQTARSPRRDRCEILVCPL